MKSSSYSRWDWPAAAILIAAVFTVAVRLESTDWTKDLGFVESLAVLGTILGLALGVSQFERRGTRWLVCGYTLVILSAQLVRIIPGEKTALGQLASLGGRLAASFSLLFNGKAIEDHLFFVSLMAILFWSIGIYSGYKLMRQPTVLPVLLPSTVPILIIQYYDGYKTERIWGMAFYFFLSLLLIGRMNFLKSRERWDEKRVVAGSEPEFDLNKNIAVAAAVIILAAWTLPAPTAIIPTAARAWRSFNEPFASTRQHINDMLAALQGGGNQDPADALFGNAMGLGRSAGSGESVIFSVKTPQNNLPRLYWRMRTYDIYRNGVWQVSNSQETPFDPDDGSLELSEIMPGRTGEFIFTWQARRSGTLATPPLPVWASHSGSIQTARSKGGEIEPLGWRVSPNLERGDQYKIHAVLLNPTRKELRNSGDEYPDWIKERYLQVPQEISAELNHLASQITNGKQTGFDKAEAVTAFLRKNMSYAETIPDPPPGMDPLNWFLFGWKSGFCNYYASAEVLLLRSAGVPARMVVGFAQGKIDNNGIYTVRGIDSHAWPEVYFPGIGWVEFEPTVSQDVIVRPSGEEPVSSANNNPRSGSIDEQDKDRRGAREIEPSTLTTEQQGPFLGLSRSMWLWIFIITLVTACLVVSIWQLQKRQSFSRRIPHTVKAIYNRYNLKNPPWLDRWVRWGEVSAVERAFNAINQSLQWLRNPQPDHVTPAERALLLKSIIPDASKEIDILSVALEQTLFTPRPADSASALRASWRLRLFAIRKILFRKFFRDM